MKFFSLFAIFLINSVYAQDIDLAWLKREPLSNWPVESTVLTNSPTFEVSITASDDLDERCLQPLLSKEQYLKTLEHFHQQTLPELEGAFQKLSDIHPAYKAAINRAGPFKILLELRSDINCSANGTTSQEEEAQSATRNERELYLGIGTKLTHYEGFDKFAFHEAGHFLTNLFISRSSTEGVPLEETIADAFSIWARNDAPYFGDWDQSIIDEWQTILNTNPSDSILWIATFHNLESSNHPYMRDFRKEFGLDRFFSFSESHFTSSVINHVLLQLSGDYYARLERLLWLLAEKPALFTTNRLDLLMAEFATREDPVLRHLGWHHTFEQITATQIFKRKNYPDRVKFSFNQSTLKLDYGLTTNTYGLRIIPYDLRINGKSFFATSAFPSEDEQFILRKVNECRNDYADLPCVCPARGDVLSVKYFFNRQGNGYLETEDIKVPMQFDGSCYELDTFYELIEL